MDNIQEHIENFNIAMETKKVWNGNARNKDIITKIKISQK